MKKTYTVKMIIMLLSISSYSTKEDQINLDLSFEERKEILQKQLQEVVDEITSPEYKKEKEIGSKLEEPQHKKIIDNLKSKKFSKSISDCKTREERDEYYKEKFYIHDDNPNAQKILNELEDSRIKQEQDMENDKKERGNYIKKKNEENDNDQGCILF